MGILLCGQCLGAATAIASATNNPGHKAGTESSSIMVVRYIDRGQLDSRNAYKFELIRAALEATRPEYGEYKIEPYIVEPTPKRQVLLISEGQVLNLLWASPGSVNSQADVITIPIDILRGLLGYRVCLTNKASNINFNSIQELNDLKKIKLGQGAGWSDIGVYLHNNIEPVEAPTFEGLIGMLAMNRFDCLPLGIDEITQVYRDNKEKYPPLRIEKNFLLHYNFPLYLYVSKHYPEIAKRIELGLHKLEKNGTFDELYMKYLAHDVEDLHVAQRKIICLTSPYINSTNKCQLVLPMQPLQADDGPTEKH